MLFSPDKKFLFVHIPKTAGTSLKIALKPYEAKNPEAFTEDPKMLDFLQARSPRLKSQGMIFPNHIQVSTIQKLMNLDLNQLTVFTVIRNPWSRLFSLYQHYQRDSIHPYAKMANEYSFKKFVRFLLLNKKSAPCIDSLPQIDYLLNRKNRIGVNYLLKLEELIPALTVLCGKLELAIELPTMNVSSQNSSYVEVCDGETIQLISEYEKGIIALGKYVYGQEISSSHSVIEVGTVDNS